MAKKPSDWDRKRARALDHWINVGNVGWTYDRDIDETFDEQWVRAHPKPPPPPPPAPPPRRRYHPSLDAIVRCRRRYLATLPNIKGKDPRFACWACGRTDAQPLEKAHIHAFSRGGSGLPSNFFLLCYSCHCGQEDMFGLGGSRREHHQWLREHWSRKVIDDMMERARASFAAAGSALPTPR